MPQVVAAGPANGWYGSSLFGAGGFGGGGLGGFPNQFSGSSQFGSPIQSAWGNETFVPPAWGSGANAGTGLPGSSPFHQSSPSYGTSGYGSPQSYAPSSSGLTVLGQGVGGSPQNYAPSSSGYNTQIGLDGGFGGGSALSGGYGAPASPGSIGGGSSGGGVTFGSGGGSFGGGPSFGGGGSAFPSGGAPLNFGAETGPEQQQQLSALSSSLGSGGSITPQFLEMANSLGLSSPQAQAFASSAGGVNQNAAQTQIPGGVNPADLPSQFASETSGFGNPYYSLAQVIQSEAGNSQEGQFAVAATLANREANPAFAQQYGDLLGQANAPGQFAGHLTGPGGPGNIVPASQVGASAQEIAQALQSGTLGSLGQLGNALYFLAQTSAGGAQMAAHGGTPMGGGTAATNNVFSNVLSPYGPSSSYNPPQYTLGNYAREAADPFGSAYGSVPFGQMAANLSSSGFPILQSGANGYGYPAYGASTMSDALLGNMGFNTNGDYTTQLLAQMDAGYGGGNSQSDNSNYGYGDAGYGGGSTQSDTNSNYGVPVYTYGNDIGNNPSDYGNIGGYSPSYGADFGGSGGVTDLGTMDTSGSSGSFDSSGGYSGSTDTSGSSDSSGGGGF